jgi:hypothetical protein
LAETGQVGREDQQEVLDVEGANAKVAGALLFWEMGGDMKRLIFGVLVVCVSFAGRMAAVPQSPAAGQPQGAPNFSGTWITTSPQSGVGQVLEIKQDWKAVSLTHDGGPAGHATVYPLDGSTLTSETATHGQKIPVRTRARWDGESLVLTMTWTIANVTTTARQTLVLDEKGQLRYNSTELVDGRAPKTTEATLVRR